MKIPCTKLFSLLATFAAAALVAGCAPRGESHTVEQILNDARTAYNAMTPDVGPEVGGALKSLSSSLDKLAGLGGGGDARQVASGVAEGLSTLLPKAGYTQRAQMTELIHQYRTLANAQGSPTTLGAPNLKLVVARTYTLLSSELVSTRFRIS